MIHTNLHPLAVDAARAGRHWFAWGPFAARRYAERRGVPASLITLARVLAAAEKAGIRC